MPTKRNRVYQFETTIYVIINIRRLILSRFPYQINLYKIVFNNLKKHLSGSERVVKRLTKKWKDMSFNYVIKFPRDQENSIFRAFVNCFSKLIAHVCQGLVEKTIPRILNGSLDQCSGRPICGQRFPDDPAFDPILTALHFSKLIFRPEHNYCKIVQYIYKFHQAAF